MELLLEFPEALEDVGVTEGNDAFDVDAGVVEFVDVLGTDVEAGELGVTSVRLPNRRRSPGGVLLSIPLPVS